MFSRATPMQGTSDLAVSDTQSVVALPTLDLTTTANYFVNTATGSDAGAGTSGDPWKTISYALSQVPLGAGAYIVDVYGGDSSTENGLTQNNLCWNRAFAGTVLLRDRTFMSTGVKSKVYGSSTSRACLLGAGSRKNQNVTFYGFQIGNDATAYSSATMQFSDTLAGTDRMNNCFFINTDFRQFSSSANCVFIRSENRPSATVGCYDNSFIGCDFQNTHASGGYIFTCSPLTPASATGVPSGLVFSLCAWSAFKGWAQTFYASATVFDRCTGVARDTAASSYGLLLGNDGTAPADVRICAGTTIIGGTYTGDHAVIIGGGATGTMINGITSTGTAYGLVLKEDVDTMVYNSRFTSTSTGVTCIRVKGSNRAIMHNNNIYATASSSGWAVYISAGDTANKITAFKFTGNRVQALGGKCFNWPAAAGDNGGGVCNGNTWIKASGTADWGQIIGTTGITTISAMQGAWLGSLNYDGNSSADQLVNA